MKKLSFLNKIFWLFMALSASLVMFSSCDDGEPGSGGSSDTKRIRKITHTSTGSDNLTRLFQYDNEGRLTKETRMRQDFTTTLDYVYTSNKIIKTEVETRNGSSTTRATTIYQLNSEGLIFEVEEVKHTNDNIRTFQHSYNQQNQLVKEITEYQYGSSTLDVVWTNGNIVKFISTTDGNSRITDFSYTNYEDKIGLSMVILGIDFALIKYSGTKCENLVIEKNERPDAYDDADTSYQYELDRDGYVTKMMTTAKDDDGRPTTSTLHFEYE